MRRALLVLITVSLLAATPAVASAASTEKTDGDDTAMNLDLSKISMTLEKKKVIVAMRFHQDVANADLEDTGSVSVTYKIGPHTYRNAFVKTQPQGGVAGQICTYEDDDPRSYACSGFAAGRPSDRAVRLVIPRRLIEEGAATFRWQGSANAGEGDAGCERADGCRDRVPDDGSSWLVWRP